MDNTRPYTNFQGTSSVKVVYLYNNLHHVGGFLVFLLKRTRGGGGNIKITIKRTQVLGHALLPYLKKGVGLINI